MEEALLPCSYKAVQVATSVSMPQAEAERIPEISLYLQQPVTPCPLVTNVGQMAIAVMKAPLMQPVRAVLKACTCAHHILIAIVIKPRPMRIVMPGVPFHSVEQILMLAAMVKTMAQLM